MAQQFPAKSLITRLVGALPPSRALGMGVLLIILLPVLATAMPPLLDYPNHIVRFWLLSGGAAHLPVSRFFQVDWGQTATNIGMDAIAAVVGLAFPAEITGRIILGAAAVLPPVGAILVSRRLFGGLSYWHILLCLTAWTMVLLTGFMSFQLGLGAALIALWLDVVNAGQSRLKAMIRQSLQVLIVILVHPFGAIFYAVLATGITVGDRAAILIERMQWAGLARRLGWAWLPFVIGGGVIGLRIMLFAQASGDADPGFTFPQLVWEDPDWAHMTIDHLFWAFIGPLRSYSLPVDIAFLAVLWLPVIAACFQKSLRLHGGLAVAGLALFLFSLVCPQGIGSTSMVDVRLWTMAQLMMPIALYPGIDLSRTPLKSHATAVLCTLALMAVGARSIWLTHVWQQRQADVASLYRAMDFIPSGARVLPLKGSADDEDDMPAGRYVGGMTPSFNHLPTLAVMRRGAYVPTIFAQAGKQPLRVREPYNDTHEVSGGLLGTVDDLKNENTGLDAFLNAGWRTKFDYVLVVDADRDVKNRVIGDGTCLVTDQGFARLYRIEKSPGPCPGQTRLLP